MTVEKQTAGVDRRSFLRAGGMAAGAAVFGGTALQALTARMAEASPDPARQRPGANVDYGPLEPVAALNTGDRWLALPAGFAYTVLTETGAPMSDGLVTPRAHDGMGSFARSGGTTRLICNHEIRFGGRPASQGTFVIDGAGSYDPTAGGGTTSIDFDPRAFRTPSGGKVRDFVSMRGSVVNCAGGVALGQRAWITSEEIVQGPDSTPPTAKRHGYNYLVPAGADSPVAPEPLVAMGRFAHEAVAVDPRSGLVYETEDGGTGVGSGFYRFLPVDPRDLAKGGELQMLAVKGRPQADLREGQRQGAPLPVEWVTIADPDPAGAHDVFDQGFAQGGAKFNRLEGCWEGGGSIFFASTSGGDVKNGDVNSDGFLEGYGQIWEYKPRGDAGGRLVLLFESPDGDVLDSPDNIVVTPRGGILICEDDASSANEGQNDASRFFGEDKNRLIGLTMRGEAFAFAENALSEAELAGACWSADGQFLFVNIYGEDVAGSGGTMAITGPWERGAL